MRILPDGQGNVNEARSLTDNVTEGTMAETERMSVNERRKYLHKMRSRYWQTTGKGDRSRLLDEMQTVTGLHRKSVLRLIHGELLANRAESNAEFSTVQTRKIDLQERQAAKKTFKNLAFLAAWR
jgi:hypothetical protein